MAFTNRYLVNFYVYSKIKNVVTKTFSVLLLYSINMVEVLKIIF